MERLLLMGDAELKKFLEANGVPKNRLNNLKKWIHQKTAVDFDQMSDFSKAARASMKEKGVLNPLKIIASVEASDKESVKFLFETEDGERIETVLIYDADKERKTLCVSSQVGCSLSCVYCATGKLGFKRNLTAEEIVAQVFQVNRFIIERENIKPAGRVLQNIVFMGMGEPLLNSKAVYQSIEILNQEDKFHLGARHMVISTAGISPEIRNLAGFSKQVRLAISLNTVNQDKRKILMPIAKKYNIDTLIESVRFYQEKTGRRVTFEYILIQGFNDTEGDVVQLKRKLRGIKFNVNIIPLNPVEGVAFNPPSASEIEKFAGFLKKHGVSYVLRLSKGDEIAAACGQLGLKWQKAQDNSVSDIIS